MSTEVLEILAKIDRLDAAGQNELQAALRERARAKWEQTADIERKRSAQESLTEQEIDRATEEIRYGKKAS